MYEELIKLSRLLLGLYNRPYKRYFLAKYNLSHRLTILTGPRGIGKSTLMVQYLLSQYPETSKKILFIQTDHFLVAKFSLYEMAETFYLHGGEIICFDEIHRYPNWSMELKSIYDTFPKLKVLATGSSALQVYKGSHDLSRRAILYSMFGLSFREFLELTLNISLGSFSLQDIFNEHETLTRQITKQIDKLDKKILGLFDDYLKYGYYPYFLDFEDKGLFYKTLEHNVHYTLESDLPAVYPNLSGASIRKLEKLLSFIATSVPFIPDLRKLKNLVEIADERTLKTYLKHLEEAAIILQIQKANKKLSHLAKPEKIYLQNTALLYAIKGLSAVNSGTIREIFFACMLNNLGCNLLSPENGDFLINDTYAIEIGGKNKDFNQLKNLDHAFLAVDGIEIGYKSQIPLWLFGFLY